MLTYALLAFGILLTPFSFLTGRTTLMYCEFYDGLQAQIYDLVHIYPSGYSARIATDEWMVYWSDGCNWGRQSLAFSLVGVALLLSGIVLVYRRRNRG